MNNPNNPYSPAQQGDVRKRLDLSAPRVEPQLSVPFMQPAFNEVPVTPTKQFVFGAWQNVKDIVGPPPSPGPSMHGSESSAMGYHGFRVITSAEK